MENLDLPHAEYAKALSTRQDHTTARDVLTKRGSVLCVGRRFLTPRTTNRPQCDCVAGRQFVTLELRIEGGKPEGDCDCLQLKTPTCIQFVKLVEPRMFTRLWCCICDSPAQWCSS
ncbi:hypothetical protein AOLI_G00134140 [Acnodon oligacanthus]